MLARVLTLLFVSGVFAWGVPLAAQESTPSLPTPTQDAELADWIKQLDADRFSDRQAASDQLAHAGVRAIPALIEAADAGSPETAARAVNILAGHLTKGDAETKAAAKTALEKLAESKNTLAARRAKSALEESQQPAAPPPNAAPIPLQIFGNRGIGIQGGQFRGVGGQIQIQFQQNNAAQVRRVVITNQNGVKQIEAEDGGRKVKIKEDPNNGLEMEVTETKDGKPVTQKYQAKNADDLKQKHPDAHKIYEQYAAPPRAPAQAADAVRKSVEIRLDSLNRLTDSLERSLDRMENELGKDKAKEIKQHLDNVKKELDQAKKKLENGGEQRDPEAEKAEP